MVVAKPPAQLLATPTMIACPASSRQGTWACRPPAPLTGSLQACRPAPDIMQQRAAHLSSGAAAMPTTAAVVGDPLPLHSPARELLFRDFCEALVRVGHLKFLQLPTLDRRVQALLQGHVLAYAGKVGTQPACRGGTQTLYVCQPPAPHAPYLQERDTCMVIDCLAES